MFFKKLQTSSFATNRPSRNSSIQECLVPVASFMEGRNEVGWCERSRRVQYLRALTLEPSQVLD